MVSPLFRGTKREAISKWRTKIDFQICKLQKKHIVLKSKIISLTFTYLDVKVTNKL